MENVTGTVVTAEIASKVVRFFVERRNDSIQQYHLRGEFYEAEELQIISAYFKSGFVFVDIGANVGNHTIYAEHFLRPSKSIVFEPNPAASAVLRLNILLNGLNNVETKYIGLALGAAEGRAVMVPDPVHLANLGGTRAELTRDGPVRVCAADSLIADEAVGFIKLDIEGMEMDVLAGLTKTLHRHRPNMFIEVQDTNRAQFASWAIQSNYRVASAYRRYSASENLMIVPV